MGLAAFFFSNAGTITLTNITLHCVEREGKEKNFCQLAKNQLLIGNKMCTVHQVSALTKPTLIILTDNKVQTSSQ